MAGVVSPGMGLLAVQSMVVQGWEEATAALFGALQWGVLSFEMPGDVLGSLAGVVPPRVGAREPAATSSSGKALR